MKHQIDWKRWLLFGIIGGGLIYLTGSFLMSLGILLLLFVVDHFIGEWEDRRKRKRK